MTRAESHLVFAAGESPNTFIEELPVDLEELEPDVQDDDIDETTQAHLQIAVPAPDGPVGHSPHTLMRDDVFEDVDDGRGTAFGTRTHEFAERYILEEDVEPSNDDERHIKSFIDSLDGELRVEEDAYLCHSLLTVSRSPSPESLTSFTSVPIPSGSSTSRPTLVGTLRANTGSNSACTITCWMSGSLIER